MEDYGDDSPWSKRRRINASVAENLQDLVSFETDKQILGTLKEELDSEEDNIIDSPSTSPTMSHHRAPGARYIPSADPPHVMGDNLLGDNLLIKLITLLEEVKDTQRVHSQMLNALMKQRLQCHRWSQPEGADFPLTTIQDVQSMNEKLCDSNFMSGVVAMLGDIGGTTLDDATRRMMEFLTFRDLRLFDVLYGALKYNQVTQGINQKDAELALSKWFTGARDRGGMRAQRTRKEDSESTCKN